ncbi:MAG: hypothetical protein KHX31_01660 [Akkermansia sp.]|jgi:hypothetical protein|uniref:hypothetical protein n=1 Tax=Akkermansia sp. TaxID=1872421 RepID=UPI0025C70A05|nr:hypothetical protein [Akkermansia sp.]MBS5507320.1 hypothetical protein [Akkermansia sp.]MCD8064029.1 hypothetical protein [Akkermansia sp.]
MQYNNPEREQYLALLAYLRRRNADPAQPDNDDEITLYRGLKQNQTEPIQTNNTAGGLPPDPSVSYPSDINAMAAQQGADGEGIGTTGRLHEFIEYTFNRQWAENFSCLNVRSRGPFICIRIKKKYVNVPHPEREGGQEYGVFCASAAPVTIVEILSN